MNDVNVRSLLTDLSNSVRSMLLTILFCCCIYTGTIWVIGQVFVQAKAEGSLIYNVKEKVIGSHLIAQKFTKSEYFWSRPSAIDYNGQSSGGSNLSPTNPVLRERILQSIQSLENSSKRPIPVDLVTESGSGLDPHISIQSANYQAERISLAREVDIKAVQELIKRVSLPSSALLGQTPLINVLEINLLLDQKFPLKKP
jgi:potassium-transporting ATPase KdpC subunit